MKFNNIVNSILREDLSREDRIKALKTLKVTGITSNDIDVGFVRDIIRELCSVETTRYGGGVENILDNSDPEIIEKIGDSHSGNMIFKLTLPTKTIEKYTPENVLRDWSRKYREWGDLDLDTIDFDNINLEDYGIEQSDLYRKATRDIPGVYIDEVEDIGNDMGRFTIGYSWSSDY